MNLLTGQFRLAGTDATDFDILIADGLLGAGQFAEPTTVTEGFSQIDTIQNFVEGVKAADPGTGATGVTTLCGKDRNRLQNRSGLFDLRAQKVFGIGGIDVKIIEFGPEGFCNGNGKGGFACSPPCR